jgi:hypothetical protein
MQSDRASVEKILALPPTTPPTDVSTEQNAQAQWLSDQSMAVIVYGSQLRAMARAALSELVALRRKGRPTTRDGVGQRPPLAFPQ